MQITLDEHNILEFHTDHGIITLFMKTHDLEKLHELLEDRPWTYS